MIITTDPAGTQHDTLTTLPESTKAYKPSSPTHLCHITSQHTASMTNP